MPPQPLTVKRFCHEQAKAEGVTPNAIWQRLDRGQYPTVKRLRVNRRVVYLVPTHTTECYCPTCGQIWVPQI